MIIFKDTCRFIMLRMSIESIVKLLLVVELDRVGKKNNSPKN